MNDSITPAHRPSRDRRADTQAEQLADSVAPATNTLDPRIAEATVTVEMHYDLDYPADVRYVDGALVLRFRPDVDSADLGRFVLLVGRSVAGAADTRSA